MKKNIRKPKYLFFILKNKLFEPLHFCRISHRDELLIGEEGKVCTVYEKLINNAYK